MMEERAENQDVEDGCCDAPLAAAFAA